MHRNAKNIDETFTRWRFAKLTESAADGPLMIPAAVLTFLYYGTYLEGISHNGFTSLVPEGAFAPGLLPVFILYGFFECTRREYITMEFAEWCFGNIVLGVGPSIRAIIVIRRMTNHPDVDHALELVKMCIFSIAVSFIAQQSWRNVVRYKPLQMLITMVGWWYLTIDPKSSTNRDLQPLTVTLWCSFMVVLFQNEYALKQAFEASYGISKWTS